ncbi:MAG: PAC2 family protein [Acidimicrobiia bacterium]|nr:PAC2 family protein [Acidimicrobiia bacterium]
MYELTDRPDLNEPVLIVSFDGWVDAGGVGSAAIGVLAEDSVEIGRFDPDQIFDYRVNRPLVDFVDGRLSKVDFPKITINARSFDDKDILIVSGTEPEFRWFALGESIQRLVSEFGVSQLVCIGSVPGPVPHTYPTPILHTGTADDFESSQQTPEGLLQVPGAAVTAVEWFLSQAGLPTYGFWAQVPHYLTQTFHQAALALVERVARHLAVSLPTNDLLDRVDQQRSQLDAMVAGQPEIAAHVERLESLAGEIPSADEIGSEIERFLRNAGDDA